jgi:DNA-binding IclR family transcriptional regulator
MNTSERVVDIIDTLASAGGPSGISEISRQLGIGKNNIFRILSALECKGWVQQDNETKRYSLTGAMAEVAFRALSQLDIQKVSLPYLQELQAITGEGSALSIRVELERIFINCIPSSHNVRHIVTVGERSPLWYGSGGKSILAFMTGEEINAALNQFSKSGVSVLAEGQAVTVESLREELAQIRKQGYAVAVGERHSEVCGVSAPIFNHNQKVMGCISVSGPMSRFNREKAIQYSALVMEKAAKISSIMGAKGPRNKDCLVPAIS